MYTMVCISGRFSALAALDDLHHIRTLHQRDGQHGDPELRATYQRSVEEEQYNDSRDTAAHYGVKAQNLIYHRDLQAADRTEHDTDQQGEQQTCTDELQRHGHTLPKHRFDNDNIAILHCHTAHASFPSSLISVRSDVLRALFLALTIRRIPCTIRNRIR